MGRDKFGVKAIIEAEDRTSETLDKIGNASLAAGAAITGAFALAVKAAGDFEEGMAKVSTIYDVSNDQLNTMGKELKTLAVDFGINSNELSNALYQVGSAGVAAGDALGVVEAASKGAIGGFTDVTTAADGMTSAFNAWGIEASEATDVMDIFIAAQNAGKLTVDDMSKGMGVVANQAAAMGISLEEVAASISAITAGGTKATTAFTSYRQAMVVAGMSTADMAARAKEAGVALDTAAFEAATAQEKLIMLGEAADGDTGKLQKLFGSVEAVAAILAISGENADLYAEKMGVVEDRLGNTDEAASKMGDTFNQQMKRAKEAVTVLAQEIGEVLLPAITDATEGITAFTQAVTEFTNTRIGGFLIDTAAKIGLLLLGVGLAIRVYKAWKTVTFTLEAATLALQARFLGQIAIAHLASLGTLLHARTTDLATIAMNRATLASIRWAAGLTLVVRALNLILATLAAVMLGLDIGADVAVYRSERAAGRAADRENRAFQKFREREGPFAPGEDPVAAFLATDEGLRLRGERIRAQSIARALRAKRERETGRATGTDASLGGQMSRFSRVLGGGTADIEADIAAAKADIAGAGAAGGAGGRVALEAEVKAFGNAVETAIGDSEITDALAANTEGLEANTEELKGVKFGDPFTDEEIARITDAGFTPEGFVRKANLGQLGPEFTRQFLDPGRFGSLTGGSMASVSGAQGFAAGGFSSPVSAAPVRLQLWVSLDEGLTGRLWDEQGRDQQFRGTVEYNQ